MKNFKKVLFLSLAASFAFNQAAQANCVRHIYNNSDTFAKVEFITHKGEVYFSENILSCGSGKCVLPPHSAVAVEFSHKYGMVSGHVRLWRGLEEARTFNYYGNRLIPPAFSTCPHIEHTGNTGNVTFNTPAEGDIVFEA